MFGWWSIRVRFRPRAIVCESEAEGIVAAMRTMFTFFWLLIAGGIIFFVIVGLTQQ